MNQYRMRLPLLLEFLICLKPACRVVVAFLTLSLVAKSLEGAYSSETAWQSAINSASPGDIIEIAAGTYDGADIEIPSDVDRIVVRAETPGEVVFTGASGIKIVGNGNRVEGFRYLGTNTTDSTNHKVLEINGDLNVVAEVSVVDVNCYSYIHVTAGAQFNTIEYCHFEGFDKDSDDVLAMGRILLQPNLLDASNTRIRFCSFMNNLTAPDPVTGEYPPPGDFGREPLRFGLSSQKNYWSNSLVEFCYFYQCLGDGEIISNKSTGNVFRYNTFDNNPDAGLVLRAGQTNSVYGNYFFRSDGVRVKDAGSNAIFNNYFEECNDGLTIDYDANHGIIDNLRVANNLFVDTENRINLNVKLTSGISATNVYITNNIFYQSDAMASPPSSMFRNEGDGQIWAGNLVYLQPGSSLGLATTPSGITIGDPGLISNCEGYVQIGSTSSAIDNAEAFSLISIDGMEAYDESDMELDIAGNKRPVLADLDIGPYELSCDSCYIKPLVTRFNTGPAHRGRVDLRLPLDWTELTFDDFESGSSLSFADGGEDVELDATLHASGGVYAASIRDNSTSSILEQNASDAYDLSAYDYLKVEFDAYCTGQEGTDFSRFSFYDGSAWVTVDNFSINVDYLNDRYFKKTYILSGEDYTFGPGCRIRFERAGGNDAEYIYLDNIRVSAR